MFTGNSVAIVTPMNGSGVDYAALENLVNWQIEAGVKAIVAAGTTGESCTLTSKETEAVLSAVVQASHGRVPVIAGTGCHATYKSIEQTQKAQKLGCDGALIITPYYNKPTQQGLFEHYAAIHDACDFPVILYNNPSRAACDLSVETTLRLAELKNIVGLKDATGDMARHKALVQEAPKAFKLFSGDDGSCLEYMRLGGHGVISIASNLVPQQMTDLAQAATHGGLEEARLIDQALSSLYTMLTVESNPIPVKWALERMGRIHRGIRLPLTWLTEKNQQSFIKILDKVVGATHA